MEYCDLGILEKHYNVIYDTDLGFCTVRPLYLPYVKWGFTKPQAVDTARAQKILRKYVKRFRGYEKYQDIILPDEIYNSAYHSSCYKAFTALKRQAFATLGEENSTDDQLKEIFNSIQKFICQLYNAKKSIDVDDERYQLFVNNYKASDVN
ncbi:hypothetical protein ACJJTC_014380 [Scirpophaga incertulas]